MSNFSWGDRVWVRDEEHLEWVEGRYYRNNGHGPHPHRAMTELNAIPNFKYCIADSEHQKLRKMGCANCGKDRNSIDCNSYSAPDKENIRFCSGWISIEEYQKLKEEEPCKHEIYGRESAKENLFCKECGIEMDFYGRPKDTNLESGTFQNGNNQLGQEDEMIGWVELGHYQGGDSEEAMYHVITNQNLLKQGQDNINKRLGDLEASRGKLAKTDVKDILKRLDKLDKHYHIFGEVDE